MKLYGLELWALGLPSAAKPAGLGFGPGLRCP